MNVIILTLLNVCFMFSSCLFGTRHRTIEQPMEPRPYRSQNFPQIQLSPSRAENFPQIDFRLYESEDLQRIERSRHMEALQPIQPSELGHPANLEPIRPPIRPPYNNFPIRINLGSVCPTFIILLAIITASVEILSLVDEVLCKHLPTFLCITMTIIQFIDAAPENMSVLTQRFKGLLIFAFFTF